MKVSFRIHTKRKVPTHSPTHSLAYSLTHLLTHSLTHLLTYLLTHSLTHSPTHSMQGTMVHISLLFGVEFAAICLVYALYRFNRAVFTLLSLLKMLIQSKIHSLRYGNTNYNIITFLEEIVDRDPERVQFICVEDDRNVTLHFIDNYANQFYYWLRSNYPKLKSHDTIAIMINNKPEFLSLWMGTYSLAYSLDYSLTYSLILTHLLTHLLTPLLTHLRRYR